MRKPEPAWAVDIADLDAAQAKGARTLRLHERGSGRVFEAPLARVRALGFAVSRGHNRQVALPLRLWDGGVERPAQATLWEVAP